MGQVRRRHNKMTVTDAAIAAEQQQQQAGSSGTGHAAGAGKPLHPVINVAITLVLACGFWVAMQTLARYAAHLAPHHQSTPAA
jgi:hypothetical protein